MLMFYPHFYSQHCCSVWNKAINETIFHPKTFVSDVCVARNIFQKLKSAKRIHHRDVARLKSTGRSRPLRNEPHHVVQPDCYSIFFLFILSILLVFVLRKRAQSYLLPLNASKTGKSIARKYQERDYLLMNSN